MTAAIHWINAKIPRDRRGEVVAAFYTACLNGALMLADHVERCGREWAWGRAQ